MTRELLDSLPERSSRFDVGSRTVPRHQPDCRFGGPTRLLEPPDGERFGHAEGQRGRMPVPDRPPARRTVGRRKPEAHRRRHRARSGLTAARRGVGATTGRTGDVVLQLSDIHGDIAVQLPLDGSRAPTVLDTHEYGNTRARSTSARYDWLGVQQRSGETLSGLTPVGARVHDSATGRFLQQDPVIGGGANAYGYPPDPITMYDLDGKGWFSWGRAYRITVCVGAVLWVLGTACFAAAKVRRIWQVVRRWGGIRAAISRVMSARARCLRMRRLATMMITAGSAVLGLDAVHDKCIKTKL